MSKLDKTPSQAHLDEVEVTLSEQEKELLELSGLNKKVNEKQYQITPDYQTQTTANTKSVVQTPNTGHSAAFKTSDRYAKTVETIDETKRPYHQQFKLENPVQAPTPEPMPSAGENMGLPPTPPPTDLPPPPEMPMNGGYYPPNHNAEVEQMVFGPEIGAPAQNNSSNVNGFATKTVAVMLTDFLWRDAGPWLLEEAGKCRIDVRRDKEIDPKTRSSISQAIDRHNEEIARNCQFPSKAVKEWQDAATLCMDSWGINTNVHPAVQLAYATGQLGLHARAMYLENSRSREDLERSVNDTLDAIRAATREMKMEQEKLARMRAEQQAQAEQKQAA